jgi:hypothetical protein
MSSPRRVGHEESILAMLERDTGRGSRLSSSRRLVWYGVGGALAIGLVGVFVWLDRADPAQQHAQEMTLAAAAAHTESRAADATVPRPALHGAAIVDHAAANPAAHPAQEMPTVLLTPAEKAAAPVPDVPASAGAIIRDEPPAVHADAATSEPPQALASETVQASGPDSVQAPQPPAEQLTNTAATGRAAPEKSVHRESERKHLAKTARSKPLHPHAPAKPDTAVARASQRPPSHAATKAKTGHAGRPATDAKVDSDVALISAVIQHANNQREANEAAANCEADATCASKATPEP